MRQNAQNRYACMLRIKNGKHIYIYICNLIVMLLRLTDLTVHCTSQYLTSSETMAVATLVGSSLNASWGAVKWSAHKTIVENKIKNARVRRSSVRCIDHTCHKRRIPLLNLLHQGVLCHNCGLHCIPCYDNNTPYCTECSVLWYRSIHSTHHPTPTYCRWCFGLFVPETNVFS